jgi:hypothetical protein
MNTKIRQALIAALVIVLMAAGLFGPQSSTTVNSAPPGPANRVLAHAFDIESGRVQGAKYEQPVSSGSLYAVYQAEGVIDKRVKSTNGGKGEPFAPGNLFKGLPNGGTQGCPNVFTGADGPNIRVNQDCSLRRQAEEVVVVNPTNPSNLIAGQNDSRIGFNRCGYDWSFDGGRTWGDQIPPFYQFVMADGHTSDACSDPTATFDANGNAYVGGVLFDINSAASAFVVAKSNAGIGGAFYHTPAAGSFQTYSDTPLGVIASETTPISSTTKSSSLRMLAPAARRRTMYTEPGLGLMERRAPAWVGTAPSSSANLRTAARLGHPASRSAARMRQPARPLAAKPTPMHAIRIKARIRSSARMEPFTWPLGTATRPPPALTSTWSSHAPLQRIAAIRRTGQPQSRSATTMAHNPLGRWLQLPALPGGNACPRTAIAWMTLSRVPRPWTTAANSTLSGPTFAMAAPTVIRMGQPLLPRPPATTTSFIPFRRTAAQWQPWSAVAPDGKTLWVAYYDRSYGNCESTGCNDITLAQVKDPASASPKVTYRRLTTSSMPNLVVANNPVEAGFLGDYMWVTVNGKGQPYVVWADTRGLNNTVEEDIYLWSSTLGGRH